MSEWNSLLGYNIELINDLVSDYHEGMSLMIDTKDTDRSPGTSVESVLKLPPIIKQYFILENNLRNHFVHIIVPICS